MSFINVPWRYYFYAKSPVRICRRVGTRVTHGINNHQTALNECQRAARFILAPVVLFIFSITLGAR